MITYPFDNSVYGLIWDNFYWKIERKENLTVKEIDEKLRRTQQGLRRYYAMSPKARHFGLWRNQGKLMRKEIKQLRILLKIAKRF